MTVTFANIFVRRLSLMSCSQLSCLKRICSGLPSFRYCDNLNRQVFSGFCSVASIVGADAQSGHNHLDGYYTDQKSAVRANISTESHLRELPHLTDESDASKHSVVHAGKLYPVPRDTAVTLNFASVLRPEFVARCKAFQETRLMVRQPFLETKHLLNMANYGNPAMKVVLFGKDGSGKSVSLAHVLHAVHCEGWLIIMPVQQYLWNNYFREIAQSSFKSERIDLPQEGVQFLHSLKQMNKTIFAKYGDKLLTQRSYTWSRREVTEKGTSLESLIDFGIERTKYSCDVVGAFLKEVRLSSGSWPFKTLLAVDGVNSLYGTTRIFTNVERREKLKFGQVSLAHHLRKLLESSWSNGAAVLTVDTRSNPHYKRFSHHPRYLLKEIGFKSLDPFVPVEVHDYNDSEVTSILDYLTERNWIQHPEYRQSAASRSELVFLSAKNPLSLDLACRV